MKETGEYRKYRKQTGPGKGDKPRPMKLDVFRKNYDDINWNHDAFFKNCKDYKVASKKSVLKYV